MSGDFALDISKWVEKAKGNVGAVQRKVCLDLSTGVIMDTPVLTGRARGNWQPAIIEFKDGALDTTDPGGAKTVGAVASVVKELQPGQTFTLVNNLEYIVGLEDGNSAKAPEGMLMRNVERFPGVVKAAVDSET